MLITLTKQFVGDLGLCVIMHLSMFSPGGHTGEISQPDDARGGAGFRYMQNVPPGALLIANVYEFRQHYLAPGWELDSEIYTNCLIPLVSMPPPPLAKY